MPSDRKRQIRTFNQKFWEDDHGKVVVWQKPNIWLSTWFISTVIGWFISSGWLDKTIGYVSLVSLIIWAVLEVYNGINFFRRLIGLLVILILLTSRL